MQSMVSNNRVQSMKQTEQGHRQHQRMGQNLDNKYSHANQKHYPSNNTQNTGNNDNSWVFPPRASVRQSIRTPVNAQYHSDDQVFTPNKFILLNNESSNEENMFPQSGKQKASSSIDADTVSKKTKAALV